MNNTPITDKAWDEIPHYVMSFGRATRMRDACREMERQRNELLAAVERYLPFAPNMEPIGAAKYSEQNVAAWELRKAVAKAKGETP